MWPFTKSANSADRSLERLHDRVETVERQVRSMLLEWESTYNKLRAVVARLNKRDERAEEKDAVTPAAPGESLPGNPQLTAVRGGPRLPRRNY
jgi:hypothetical protein